MKLIDPLGYCSLANDLLKQKWKEDLMSAMRRTVISRLYYAIFHYIKLNLFGPDNDPNQNHKKLHAQAQKFATDHKIDINIKDHLSQLEMMREKADYKRLQVMDDEFLRRAIKIYDLVEKDCITIWNP